MVFIFALLEDRFTIYSHLVEAIRVRLSDSDVLFSHFHSPYRAELPHRTSLWRLSTVDISSLSIKGMPAVRRVYEFMPPLTGAAQVAAFQCEGSRISDISYRRPSASITML